ncbi:MAG: sensor histidine kinase [Chloroflexota bacterium]|nr:sensor histidine kinase [Chloroflexota bacterium]
METLENPTAAAGREASYVPFDLLNKVAYVTVAVGYLYTILSSWHLTAPGFALVTVTNIAWMVLYCLVTAREGQQALWWLVALSLLSCGTLVAGVWGMGFDWLLPVVMVALVGVMYSERTSLIACAALWVVTTLILIVEEGRLNLSEQLTFVPPFLFAFAFSYILRRFVLERERKQALIADLEQSRSALDAAHTQLLEYAAQMEDLAATRERNRIAREIHDTRGHYLTGLAVQLETATKLEERGDPGLHAELIEARRVAKECLAEVRYSVAALRPAGATGGSLEIDLRRLIFEFEMVSRDIEVTTDLEGSTGEVAAELRLTLYRCAQEALTNIRKHADATKVLLRLRIDEQQAELTVLDNGLARTSVAGADPDAHTPGFGLRGVHERVALLGGSAHAAAELERGWRFEVLIPVTTFSEKPCE